MATPTSTEVARPRMKATGKGTGVFRTSSKVRVAPAAPMAVWAKLTTRSVR